MNEKYLLHTVHLKKRASPSAHSKLDIVVETKVHKWCRLKRGKHIISKDAALRNISNGSLVINGTPVVNHPSKKYQDKVRLNCYQEGDDTIHEISVGMPRQEDIKSTIITKKVFDIKFNNGRKSFLEIFANEDPNEDSSTEEDNVQDRVLPSPPFELVLDRGRVYYKDKFGDCASYLSLERKIPMSFINNITDPHQSLVVSFYSWVSLPSITEGGIFSNVESMKRYCTFITNTKNQLYGVLSEILALLEDQKSLPQLDLDVQETVQILCSNCKSIGVFLFENVIKPLEIIVSLDPEAKNEDHLQLILLDQQIFEKFSRLGSLFTGKVELEESFATVQILFDAISNYAYKLQMKKRSLDQKKSVLDDPFCRCISKHVVQIAQVYLDKYREEAEKSASLMKTAVGEGYTWREMQSSLGFYTGLKRIVFQDNFEDITVIDMNSDKVVWTDGSSQILEVKRYHKWIVVFLPAEIKFFNQTTKEHQSLKFDEGESICDIYDHSKDDLLLFSLSCSTKTLVSVNLRPLAYSSSPVLKKIIEVKEYSLQSLSLGDNLLAYLNVDEHSQIDLVVKNIENYHSVVLSNDDIEATFADRKILEFSKQQEKVKEKIEDNEEKRKMPGIMQLSSLEGVVKVIEKDVFMMGSPDTTLFKLYWFTSSRGRLCPVASALLWESGDAKCIVHQGEEMLVASVPSHIVWIYQDQIPSLLLMFENNTYSLTFMHKKKITQVLDRPTPQIDGNLNVSSVQAIRPHGTKKHAPTVGSLVAKNSTSTTLDFDIFYGFRIVF